MFEIVGKSEYSTTAKKLFFFFMIAMMENPSHQTTYTVSTMRHSLMLLWF